MFERVAPDLRHVVAHAGDMAGALDVELNSVHLLLAMFVTPCRAREVLAEVGVDEARVMVAYKKMRNATEPSAALVAVERSASQLTSSSRADTVDSMVLLASLLKVRKAMAARVLREAGVNVPELRARVIGQVTLGVDRASSTRLRAVRRASGEFITGRSRSKEVPSARVAPPAADNGELVVQPRDEVTSRVLKDNNIPAADARISQPLPPSRETTGAPPQRNAPPGRPRRDSAPPKTPAQHAPEPPAAPEPKLSPWQLDPNRYPTLIELGRNLTAQAVAGKVQPLIGREDIVENVIDVLMMRRANNPCLVGEAGVGKTAIVEGLASRIVGDTEHYGQLGQAIIVELHVSSLLAGTSYRGAFAERMTRLRNEVDAADGQVIVFVDEIHTLMGAGAGDGALDAANDLKTALARGRFPLIGATTRDEYRRYIEKDAALERRFQVVEVPEPDTEEALKILSGVAPVYAGYHKVPYSHEAVASAVHLSRRFITDRCLPDKAIGVLDRAGTLARRLGKKMVEVDDVARVVQKQTRVPMDRLLADERSRIRDLAADLRGNIVGQDRAVASISRRVRRNYAGFGDDRPLASFLFCGPPGVGKTETARALSEALFLVDDALVTFDMAEYVEAASTARLVGSPPGYVGHQQPGLLAEAMHKRPYRVLLFENIDRASGAVLGLIVQVLATGRITDNQGRLLDMRNSIIVLTTAVGTDAILAGVTRRVVGFHTPPRPVGLTEDDESTLLGHVRQQIGPEVCHAVDDMVLFRPLSEDAGREVVKRKLSRVLQRFYDNRLIRIRATPSLIEFVVERGGIDPATGARSLEAAVDEIVGDFLTDQTYEGRLRTGSDMQLFATPTGLELRDTPRAMLEQTGDVSHPTTRRGGVYRSPTAPTAKEPRG